MKHPENKSPWKSPAFRAMLALAFILALSLRLPFINNTSLWLDETLQLKCTTGPISNIWNCSPKNKPPLDYYIQWFFVREKADEPNARFHACLLGSGIVVAIGLWGMRIGGWPLSLIAMSLTLALPVLIRFSLEGRPYSLMLLAECLFFAAYWNIALSKNPLKPAKWIFLGLAVLLCIWSLYWTAIICTLCAIFTILWCLLSHTRTKQLFKELCPDKRKLLIPAISLAIPAISALPLLFRAAQAAGGSFYAPFANQMWHWKKLYLDIFAQGYDWTIFTPNARWPLIILAAIGWFGWAISKSRAAPANFCAFIFITAFYGNFLFNKLINHWMEMRYTLSALPPLIMLSAMGIESIARTATACLKMLGPKSKKLITYFYPSLISLLCLAAIIVSLNYIIKVPLKRQDWRGVCQRIKSEASEDTAILVGDYLDKPIMEFYLKRYGINRPLIIADYDTEILYNTLSTYNDVWIIFREQYVMPLEFSDALNSLIPEYPPLWRLNVRRSLPSHQLAVKRPQLSLNALSQNLPSLLILPGNDNCPFLFEGWSLPQAWGDAQVRPIDGNSAEIFFYVEQPIDLTLSARLIPFKPEIPPPLQIKIIINQHPLDYKPVLDGWNELTWQIDKKLLKLGLNQINIAPNRTVTPADVLPDNKDYRKLSAWIEKLEIKLQL